MRDLLFERVYPFAVHVARSKAISLIGRPGITRADIEDIVQEALLDLWLRLRAFDSSRSSLSTFAALVIANKIAVLAATRLRRPQVHEPAGDDFHQTVGPAEAPELRIAVAQALSTVRPELRALAADLVIFTPTELSRLTGKSRSGIYYMIRELRAAFAGAGIARGDVPARSCA